MMIAHILFNAVVIVIGFVGNLLVLLAVALNRVFHNMNSFLLASLALSDLLFAALISVPRVISVASQQWSFGENWCHGSAFLARILYLNTILHLCAVSYERYRAIVSDPLSYNGRITPKTIIISISVLWILPTAISLGPFLGWGGYEYSPETYVCTQRWDKQTTFLFLLIAFVAPFLFILVSNNKVIKVARRLEREVNVQLGSLNSVGDDQMLQLDQFANQNEINCQQQDEANMKACSQQSQQEECQETGQAIAVEDTEQDPSEKGKKSLRQAWQINLKDEYSADGAGCSQDRPSQHGNRIPVQYRLNDSIKESKPEEIKKPSPSRRIEVAWGPSAPPSLLNRYENTLSPAAAQQKIAKNTSQGGLMKVLKECKAARDVLVILGAFLTCFLPLWIHGTYRSITGDHLGSVWLLWIQSLYGTTIIWNPIIYSIRKKEFRKAARKMLKL